MKYPLLILASVFSCSSQISAQTPAMPAVPVSVMNDEPSGMKFDLKNSKQKLEQALADSVMPKLPQRSLDKKAATSPTEEKRVSLPLAKNKVRTVKNSHKAPEIMKSNLKSLELEVEPGINQVVPIAIGHYNRIVTPFEMPAVNTVSDAQISVHKNVLYVATSDNYPVTLFVTPEADDESTSISLTLSPQPIPPVEVYLKMGKSFQHLPFRNKAKRWERSQPYEQAIRDTMASIAMGEIPSGFGLSHTRDVDDPLLPHCFQDGLTYNFTEGQFMKGSSFEVAIGTVINTSSQPIEINESGCIDRYVVAIAQWPNTYLEPGDMSEVYVMMRPDLKPMSHKKRQSLIPEQRMELIPSDQHGRL